MGNRCRRLLNLMLSIIVSNSISPLWATLDFQNPHATVVLKATNAQLRIGNNQQVFGCSNRSIAEDFGHEVASAWREAYSNGVIISQTGGTKVPQTDLVTANSNVVASLNVALRTNSNATLYGLRVNSNAMVYGDRVNLAATNQQFVRTASNAFVYGTKNNSNAINALYYLPTADSIDGTQMVRYCSKHYVFHNGISSVRGWVRFNDGFTVMPRASVIMDTLVTVSGAMDLRDTGTLILNNDLYLAHNVTLTNGGNIKGRSSSTGQANTIFMGGDLTLAATTYARTLHITGDWSANANSGDLIIDGCGHTLNIGDRAQIFVDQNVTLTLRNMTVRTGPKSINNSPIQLASLGSKLALDNVIFDLGADFHFPQGQMFIHDNVVVTGTSAFVYQSPKPSYIASGATWMFDSGTTFSIAPSTYTDIPFTAGTAISNNFIVPVDQSAALFLDNCSLKTNFSGLRLRKGMVLLKDKVAIDTQASLSLDSNGPITEIGSGIYTGASSTPHAVSWTPDGRYLAVVCSDTYVVRVYRFSTLVGAVEIGNGLFTGTGSTPYSVAWSPDGRYLLVACINNDRIHIYTFNGSSLPVEIGTGLFMGGSQAPRFASWSPDGRFLAVACGSGYLRLYRFDGVSGLVAVGSGVFAGAISVVRWSSDGRYVAVAGGDAVIHVYRFNGSSALVEIGSGLSLPSYVTSLSWSPDGRWLAAGVGDWSVHVCSFDGVLSPVDVTSHDFSPVYPTGVSWSPDGRYLAIDLADFDVVSVPSVYIYGFDGVSTLSLVGGLNVDAQPASVIWSPDGKYLATVIDGTYYLRVFSCNFVPTPAALQDFPTGLLFGDSAQGAAYDADVQVAGGASVVMRGMVKDDSA